VTQTGTGQFTVSGSHSYAALGPHTVTVSVIDDGGSTATATIQVMVFAYPQVGGFVIGDGNDATGTSVTFWGPQWATSNTLSKTATPPPSFKGFEDSTRPPVCGTTWATDPGNSTPPPAGPLPSYMGVLVSSQVTASGSGPVISGDTPHIVVVKTNTGYNPAVGHAGTGTIVFRAC
jgi:hypothetical protein